MLLPRLLVALALLAFAGSPAAAQTGTAQPGTPPAAGSQIDPTTVIVARVGDGTITLADLIAVHEDLPEQFRQVPLQVIYAALLERAIDGRLIADAARADKLDQRDDVKRRVRRAEEQAMSEVYLSESIAAEITEEALRARYETFAADIGEREEVNARHILVETEDAAAAVIAELGKGADFADLAKTRSMDGSAAEGGDLGWFTAEQMVPEFSEAAFALKAGDSTREPVQSPFGWHVIKLEARRSVGAPPFEQIQDQLAAEMTRDLINERLAGLRSDVTVERVAPDGSPMPAPR
jgi:peptidyl-prolyl cis-trans isomerase C